MCKAPAEMIDPQVCDALLLGTSFQAPFSPHTPPIRAPQTEDAWNHLNQAVDSEYILTASQGGHFPRATNASTLERHEHPLVNDARSIFSSMGWNI